MDKHMYMTSFPMILNPLSMPQHFTCIIHNVKKITFNIQAPFSTQNRENVPVGTPKPPTPPCRQNILARLPRPTESKPYKKPADIEQEEIETKQIHPGPASSSKMRPVSVLRRAQNR